MVCVATKAVDAENIGAGCCSRGICSGGAVIANAVPFPLPVTFIHTRSDFSFVISFVTFGC